MWLFRSGMVLAAYCGIIVYTGVRLLNLARYFSPSVKAPVFWPLYLLVCFSFVWTALPRGDWLRPVRAAAMNILPALLYFFLALLLLDGTRLVLRLAKGAFPGRGFTAAGIGAALCLAALVTLSGALHARNIRAAYYDIAVKKGAGEAPLRVVLVSDLHIGTTVGRKWAANIVDAVNRAEPDIICVAGDVFDGNIDALKESEGVTEELRRLKAPLGVFACPGNHDVDRLAPGGEGSTDRIRDFLENAGIVFLEDELALVDGRFYLAGRRDARPIGMNRERKNASGITAGIDKSMPLIIMDHQPVDFPGLERAGADLILSGHTHRGQFFPGSLATERIFKKAGAAHYGYWRGKTSQAVISSGAGVWGPSVRIATDSEIAVVDIEFGE